MPVVRQSFTFGTEISIVAHSTLVSVTSDVALVGCAQRSIAVNTTMCRLGHTKNLDWGVEGCKSMTRMLVVSIRDAGCTVVEIWARQTLVSNSVDALINN